MGRRTQKGGEDVYLLDVVPQTNIEEGYPPLGVIFGHLKQHLVKHINKSNEKCA
jgi:hypothetical protein